MRKSMVHISFDPVESFVPRVPSNRIEGELEEDSITERICASSTILGALRGVPQGGDVLFQMKRLGIPIIIHAYYLEGEHIVPTEQQVPDRCVTDEVWFLKAPEKVRRVDYQITDFELLPVEGAERSFLFVLNASIKRCPYGDNKKNLCELLQRDMPKIIDDFSFREIMLNIGKDLFSLKKERGL